MVTQVDLGAVFADPLWRMDHLYTIINEQGEAVPFKLRPAQRRFLENLHYRNIVLKARQLGFTTVIDLMALDMTLFNRDFTAVIIAETKDKAADIFAAKVMYPYEHLPEEIKKWCPIVAHSADGEVRFRNGGAIKVMVSARSGTCQFLHMTTRAAPKRAGAKHRALEVRSAGVPPKKN